MAKTPKISIPTAPRLGMVETPTPEQASILRHATLKDGSVPNALRTMAHNLELLKRINAVGGYFLRFGTLPERGVKLVILRVAHRTGSLYEFAQHRKMSLNAGVLTPQEVAGVTTDTYPWNEEDRLYVRAVDELFDHSCLGEGTWAGLSKRLAPESMIELVLLAGFYQTLAGFLNSAGIQLDQHVEDRDWPAGRQA